MVSEKVISIVDELIPVFRKVVCGEYAIALAGAHAKGKDDIHSDLDVFVYTQDIIAFEDRKAIFSEIADSSNNISISSDIVSSPWGGSIDFVYHGCKVEADIRSISKLEECVNDSINGIIKIYPEIWTLNGYYSYICLSEIEFIKPVDDPFGIINRLKEKISTYPPALKKAIIDKFWWRSKFWTNNFHYISAINRMDIVYTSGIINQTIQNMVQVLFALNEKYFYGDKKIELQLKGLDFCPRSLIDNIELLICARKDVEYLQRQRAILNEITNQISMRLK